MTLQKFIKFCQIHGTEEPRVDHSLSPLIHRVNSNPSLIGIRAVKQRWHDIALPYEEELPRHMEGIIVCQDEEVYLLHYRARGARGRELPPGIKAQYEFLKRTFGILPHHLIIGNSSGNKIDYTSISPRINDLLKRDRYKSRAS